MHILFPFNNIFFNLTCAPALSLLFFIFLVPPSATGLGQVYIVRFQVQSRWVAVYYSVTSSRTISTNNHHHHHHLLAPWTEGEEGGGSKRTNVIIEPNKHPAEFLVAFHHDPDSRADAFVD